MWANAERLRFLNIPGPVSSAVHPVSGKEVEVKISISMQITFNDGTPVIKALDELQSQVTQTLDAFEFEFK